MLYWPAALMSFYSPVVRLKNARVVVHEGRNWVVQQVYATQHHMVVKMCAVIFAAVKEGDLSCDGTMHVAVWCYLENASRWGLRYSSTKTAVSGY